MVAVLLGFVLIGVGIYLLGKIAIGVALLILGMSIFNSLAK